MNRTFPLKAADIVVPNLPMRNLHTDFRILAQVARSPDASTSSLAQRALKACNDIMNTFRRVEGDEEDKGLLDGMAQKCRDIAWGVLGSLDEASTKKLAVWDKSEREAKIWGIGHW